MSTRTQRLLAALLVALATCVARAQQRRAEAPPPASDDAAPPEQPFESIEEAGEAQRRIEDTDARKDPVALLQRARDHMEEAERHLLKAATWRRAEDTQAAAGPKAPPGPDAPSAAKKNQDEALSELEKVPLRQGPPASGAATESPSRAGQAQSEAQQALDAAAEAASRAASAQQDAQQAMSSAADAVSKAMAEAQKLQDDALRELEAVIRIARQHQRTTPGNGGRPRRPGQEPPPQKPRDPAPPEAGNEPAPKPYETPPHEPPPNFLAPRETDLGKRWGNLPARLREELLQARNEEFIPEYRDRLERYYKFLSEEESR